MPIGFQPAHSARIISAAARRPNSAAAASSRRMWLLPALTALLTAVLLLVNFCRLPAAEQELKADTSRSTHENALHSIPLENFSADSKAKVAAVLNNTTIFRRLPVQVVECEPELFHFLVRQPEVVVNIWQVMGVSSITMDRPDETHFRCADGEGTTAHGEFVFRNHDTQIIYAEGLYEGPLFPRPVRGQAVIVLKTASIRETNGRYYVTARLDTFVHVDNVGIEIVAKMFQGWLGHTIDHNFSEAVSFLGSVSHAAENNPQGMRRLAAKLNRVDDSHRRQFIALTDQVADKMSGMQLADSDDPALAKVLTTTTAQSK